MSSFKDLTGKRFGNLIVVKPTDKRKDDCVIWECKCDCGNTCYVSRKYLTPGYNRSCGCSKGKKV